MKPHMKPCPECDGTGFVIREMQHKDGSFEDHEVDCDNCGGEGDIIDGEYEEGLGDWLFHKQRDEEL